jgi:hypothetical protein
MDNIGKNLIYIGIICLLGGILLIYTPILNWIGKLPGDIKVEKENFRFYFPITTSIVISIVLSLLFSIRKWL